MAVVVDGERQTEILTDRDREKETERDGTERER